MKKMPLWAKGLQKLLMDWTAVQPKDSRVDAKIRVKGAKSVSIYAETSHLSAAERKRRFGNKVAVRARIAPKLRGWGWEAVFVTHPVKNNPAMHFDKGQFVMLFFNGMPIGLVGDFKITGEAHGLFLSFKVPLYGHAVHEMWHPNP